VIAINSDNQLVIFVGQDDVTTISTAKELAAKTSSWPMGRLVQLHNANKPQGVKPVKKFENRDIAVRRIWAIAATLEKDISTETPVVEKEVTAPKAKAQKAKAVAAPKAIAAQRSDSKKSQAITMLSRKNGASNQEMQAAFAWQPHTVRGFIAGCLKQKLGLTVESFKTAAGERQYRINQ